MRVDWKLTQADLENGHKMAVVVVVVSWLKSNALTFITVQQMVTYAHQVFFHFVVSPLEPLLEAIHWVEQFFCSYAGKELHIEHANKSAFHCITTEFLALLQCKFNNICNLFTVMTAVPC